VVVVTFCGSIVTAPVAVWIRRWLFGVPLSSHTTAAVPVAFTDAHG
jgi:hypothetical protein